MPARGLSLQDLSSRLPAPWDSAHPKKNLPEAKTADGGEEAVVFVSELFRDI